jgi:hypothetical protein
MKTSTINLSLHGDAENVKSVCGRFTDDFETKQKVTYEVTGNLATIHKIEPVIKTQINLPLPFIVPINDLGSGVLVSVDINCNTLAAYQSTCPTPQWAAKRSSAPAFPGPRTEAFLTGTLI